jgi:hypothetical protein
MYMIHKLGQSIGPLDHTSGLRTRVRIDPNRALLSLMSKLKVRVLALIKAAKTSHQYPFLSSKLLAILTLLPRINPPIKG